MFPSSFSPEAQVRQWFGLSQAQLARYLGVRVPAVAHAEAGRRPLPVRALARLRPLALAVPAPDAATEAAAGLPLPWRPPPPPPQPPAGLPEPLRRRHRDLRLLAQSLIGRLTKQQVHAAALAARRRGLAQLAGLLPPIPVESVAWRAWVADLFAELALADPDPAAAAVETRLLAARLAGIRAELSALGEGELG